MELSLFSSTQLIGVVLGSFLFKILYKGNNKNTQASRILAYFNLLIVATLLGRFLISLDLVPEVVGYLSDMIIFIFGPLSYFFVRSFLKQSFNITYKWHYFPLLNHFLAVIVLTSQNQLNPFSEMLYIDRINTFSYGMYAECLAILQLQLYMGLSARSIFKSIKEEKNELSFNQFPKIFLWLIILIELAILLWASGYVSRVYNIGFTQLSYDLTWLVLPLITMMLTYSFLDQAEMFKIEPEKKSALSDDKIEDVNQKILSLMDNEKYFTNSRLTKTELAEKLNTNSTLISKAINSIHNKNFFEFINEYRIKEFVERAKDEKYKALTHIALANDVGFHSKATFYSSFKKYYGMTPKEYLS